MENLTPSVVLIPVIAALAVIGYIWCMIHYLWGTLAASAALAALMWWQSPPSGANIIYWVAGGLLVILALGITAKFRKTSPRPTPPGAKGESSDIVIDGTNVLFWDGDADIRVLRAVTGALQGRGLSPYVFLDASTRHHLGDKTLYQKGFSKALGLPAKRVMVCPAGTEADAFILKFAKEHQLPIVSNDRFGDRAQQAKHIKRVTGVFARGKPIFEGL